jgi:thiosulfate/3-mercaptopyruvate sulfurtransferase
MFALGRRVFVGGIHRAMSTAQSAPLLVTPSQVARLPPQSTVFIDASWVMPNSPRKPKEEFAAIRIPNAKFLDIDEVASRTEEGAKLGLQHMMPDSQVFARACGRVLYNCCTLSSKCNDFV